MLKSRIQILENDGSKDVERAKAEVAMKDQKIKEL
jgi:hypothetical protein